jgi:hypothetical protein
LEIDLELAFDFGEGLPESGGTLLKKCVSPEIELLQTCLGKNGCESHEPIGAESAMAEVESAAPNNWIWTSSHGRLRV